MDKRKRITLLMVGLAVLTNHLSGYWGFEILGLVGLALYFQVYGRRLHHPLLNILVLFVSLMSIALSVLGAIVVSFGILG